MRFVLLISLLFLAIQLFGQAPVKNGLVAYYPFTGNANDYSGNNLNGVVMGATLTTDRFNNPNSAYHFSAADSHYIFVPTDTLLNFSHNLTMAFWVYKESYGGPDSSNAIMSVLHKGRDVHNSYGFYTVNYTDRFYVRNFGIGGANTDVPSKLTLNNWHFVTGVLDSAANEIRYYVDGMLLQTRTGINFEANNQYPLLIGRHFKEIDGTGGYGFPFDGKIDDVRLYNRPLSGFEINLLYNEQCSGFSTILVSDITLCKGDTAVLTTIGGDNFSWTPSSLIGIPNDPYLIPMNTTTYTVIVSKVNGCADTHQVTINVSNPPTAPIITASETLICSGDSVNLSFTQGYASYTLSPDPGIPLDSLITIYPTDSETYILSVTDQYGCSYKDSVTVTVAICIGIKEASTDYFSVHPNPSNGNFQLKLNQGISEKSDLTIFDMTGRVIIKNSINRNEKTVPIDLQEFSDGIYFIQVNFGERIIMKKVIKQ